MYKEVKVIEIITRIRGFEGWNIEEGRNQRFMLLFRMVGEYR
jgi:hypothetical protein